MAYGYTLPSARKQIAQKLSPSNFYDRFWKAKRILKRKKSSTQLRAQARKTLSFYRHHMESAQAVETSGNQRPSSLLG